MTRFGSTLVIGLLTTAVWAVGGCVSSPSKPVDSARYRSTGVYHTVKRHQTLWRICKTYGVEMAEVARINGIRDVNRIQAGQRIFIPGAEKIRNVGIYIEDLTPVKKKEATVDLSRIKGRFTWPVRGAVLREFGISKGRKHDGIDIAASHGTPIRSAGSGEVLYSGNEVRGYGNIVIIKHGPIFTSIYAQNEVNLVQEGDRVEQGQMIGRVGRAGTTEGPRLHFEIRNHNRPIDPRLVLP